MACPLIALDPREALLAIAAERKESLSNLSVLIGRNRAYLQQYIRRGSPRRLPEKDRKLLSKYLGVDEERLGAINENDVQLLPDRALAYRRLSRSST